MTVVILSFCSFLALFTIVGVLSILRKESTSTDYLVAGRSVSPWLTALSSVATNNSGFMFIGLIGFTYRFGVQAIWLQLGWMVGDLIMWLFIHRRVREMSGALGAKSVPALLDTRADGSVGNGAIRVVAGILTFVFLGGYAAAQLQAGSTSLHALFGWDMKIGAILGAGIVIVYCFSGGLRASIWTDAVQSMVMLLSMVVLLGTCVYTVGGPVTLFARLEAMDPALISWIPDDLALGFGLYLLGFVFGGLGAVGQPHILIRTMALDSADNIARTRAIYFAWYIPFSIAAVSAGLYARVLLPGLMAGAQPDQVAQATEHALPLLAVELLPQVFIGMTLAGIFAATMSTADSQILSCSAAVTQDIAPRWQSSYLASKAATLSVAALALAIALYASSGVFDLVLIAWSALGATIGPLLLVRISGRVVSPRLGLVMMGSGLLTVILWGQSSHADAVFKLLPGMLVPLAIYAIASNWDRVATRADSA